jgi:mRNA-degrading endonuclease RelE of RelBE toxin-antitoxin system
MSCRTRAGGEDLFHLAAACDEYSSTIQGKNGRSCKALAGAGRTLESNVDAIPPGNQDEAREQLRALPEEQRRNVGWRLEQLQNDLAGDVKKLAARTHEYRLRVGSVRILFMLEGNLIVVYAVKDRKEAYE